MDIEELLSTNLRVHQGGTLTLGVDKDVARFLHRTISDDQRTLETGVGLSTVIFALRGSKHIAITPQQAEIDQVKEFCSHHAISTDNIEFVVGFSEDVLPKMALPPLDFVLIDGGHAFPVPYIDWRYTVPHLQVGGRMVVDDCQLDTGAVLRNFLRQEDEWIEERDFFGRTSVFKLQKPYEFKDWYQQPYVKAKSKKLQYLFWLRKAVYLIGRRNFRALYDSTNRTLDSRRK